MNFIGYHSEALGAAVDLVNAVTDDPEGQAPDQLRRVLLDHHYRVEDAPAGLESTMRAWSRQLRTVFDAATVDDCAAAVNALLTDVTIAPHLSAHDGEAWHLHFTSAAEPVVERMRSTTAFALAVLVAEYGLDRHGRCSAANCERVFADTSRNAARRYCSSACANRASVAAHRARRKEQQAATQG